MKTFLRNVLVASFLIFKTSLAWSVDSGITYFGRLINPTGHPVTSSSVQFKIQLRTPGSENCLMYEEIQIKDLSDSDGIFSLTINDGTGTRTDSSGFSLDKVFANRGSFNFAAGKCANGTIYNTTPSDGRKIQVLFNDGSFAAGTWEPMPTVPINFVPMAIESTQIGGYKKEQLLRIADAVDTTNTELNATNWNKLWALISGSSTQYVSPGSATFTAAPTWSGTPSSANDLVNKSYVDSAVTSGMPNVGTAGTYIKVTTDAKGRVTSGTGLSESDLPTISSAGKVVGSAITSGALSGTTSINTSGNLITTGTVQGAISSATNFRIYANGNYIELKSPTGLPGNINWTLPGAYPLANGYVLSSDTAGTLSWVSPPSGSPTGTAGGDLSGNYPNPTVARLQNTPVSGTTPTIAGQILRFDGTNWTPNFISMADLRSTITGSSAMTSCSSSQTLTWSSLTDNLSCSNITVSGTNFGSQTANTILAAPNGSAGVPSFRGLVAQDLPTSGVVANTYKSVTVDTYGRVTGGSNPTNLAGYGITDALANGGQNGAIIVGSNDSNRLDLRTNGTNHFSILPNGNSGFGVSNPVAKVDIDTGTITSALPILNGTSTWNSAGTTFSAAKINITDTASAASSKLLDLQVGGISKFSVDKSGKITGDGSGLTNVGLTGSGTVNTIPLFTAAGAIGDSLLTQSGNNILANKLNLGAYISDGHAGITTKPGSELYLGLGGSYDHILLTSSNVRVGVSNFEVLGGAATMFRINSGASVFWDFNANFGVDNNLHISQTRGAGGAVILDDRPLGFAGISAPAVSPSGQGRIYFDSGSNTFKISQNGSAYADIATSSGSSSYVSKSGDTMTGPLVNNTNSASAALAVTQSGTGYSATFTGGRVGIGTTTPTVTLDVNGDTNISGVLSFPGGVGSNPGFHFNSVGTANSYGNNLGLGLDTAYNMLAQIADKSFRIVSNTGALAWQANNVGNTTQLGTLTVNGSGNSSIAGKLGIGTATPGTTLDVAGHIKNSGTAASVSSCGTSPSLVGNDTRGSVTLGTGGPTSCTITFASAFNSTPHCTISPVGGDPGASVRWWITPSTGSLILNFSSTPTSGQIFSYICME